MKGGMKNENIIQITIIIALILILCVLIVLYFNGGTNSQGNMKGNGSSSQMGAPGQGGSGGPGGQNGGDNSESVEKTGAREFSEEKSESNQLYEKQTEFVQNASHKLRTPLTIIQAKQELLLTEPNKKLKLELEYNKKIQIIKI